MRKSYTNSNSSGPRKQTMSHFKRYSELDLRNDKIDNLLITQSGLFSQLRIRRNNKLPEINYPAVQTNINSYTRVIKLQNLASQLQVSVVSLHQNLQQLKLDLQAQKNSSNDRLTKTNNILSSKLQRIQSMMKYTMDQNLGRSQKIQQSCQTLKDQTKILKDKIEEAKEMMRNIQDSMGIYTGEDKYYA